MIKKWLAKKLTKLDKNSTREEMWKYMPTKDMFHPILAESLDDNFNLKFGANFPLYIREPVNGCFSFPLFSRRYCKFLIAQGDENGKWGKNKKDPYTAFEIDLRRMNPYLNNYHVEVVAMKVINSVLHGLFDGYRASKVQNSFLIKYTLDTCLKMDSHHDEQSLVSLSINLNDEYEGGGITFVRSPEDVVNPQRGHAAMFAGNPFATHKANPITEGNRYVLVYWLK